MKVRMKMEIKIQTEYKWIHVRTTPLFIRSSNSQDMAPWEDYLKAIYYDPAHPASYAGPQKLYHIVQREGKYKIGMHKIRKFLQNQDSYSLHKPVRRRFRRNHVISAGIDDLWMCDLIDMVKFASWNDGYKYILLVIDVFSKYVWLRPLKNKTGAGVAEAFTDIFETSKRSPGRLSLDKGQEFNASVVQKLMKRHDVLYSPTQNELKATVSERCIQTIKTKLYRYFTYTENYTYLPILQDIAKSYNHQYHRTIGTAPADVTVKKEEEVRLATYFARQPGDKKYSDKRGQFTFSVGNHVRISHLKTLFSRQYDETYTGEVFVIAKRYYRGQIPVYRLKDMAGEDIKGTFYQSELQKVDVNPDQIWKIEHVIRAKGKGRNKQYLVKWRHFPAKFNSWIKATDLQ